MRLWWHLNVARALLAEDPLCWDQTGTGPGWDAIGACSWAAHRAHVWCSFWLSFRLLLCLRAAVPDSHRSWWPECIVRYNDDPLTTYDDMLAWFDRAIADEQAKEKSKCVPN